MYKNEIKNRILSVKESLKNIYHIKNISLFGSYARDEQREDSDIDLLVDFEETPDLLTFIEIEEFLSQKLGKKVDLIPARKVKKSLRKDIFNEAIVL
jgi:predicted nucleotidyltransferase